MKRYLFFTLLTATMLFAGWNRVHVSLEGINNLSALSGLDVIRSKPGYWAEVVATDEDLQQLSASGLNYHVEVADLESYYASKMSGEGPFGNYYTLAEANAILDSLHEKYPQIISERMALPNNVSNVTWDSNYLWAVKISDNVAAQEDEPEVLFTGLHHAREPIGANITVEWARWLCENYGNDPLATYFVDTRQTWIVPVVNPDGYLYNEENNPWGGGMYRKNRRPGGGVDINRNYTYNWGYDNEGSSPNPNSDTYRGPEPGSEPEIQSTMNLCKAHNFVACLNFHSHSGLFIYAWGYIEEETPDSMEFFNWGEAATRACHYVVAPGGSGLYVTNGDSDDWMYGETEAKNRIFAATPEIGTDFWQDELAFEQVEATRPMLTATSMAASAYPELEDVTWLEGDDGEISPGETVGILIRVRNMGIKDPTGDISLSLSESDPRVELVKSNAVIPSLEPYAAGSNDDDLLEVKVSPSAKPDSAIPLTLKISAAGTEFTHKLLLPVGKRLTLIDETFEDKQIPEWNTNFFVADKGPHSKKYCITDSPDGLYGNNAFYYLESGKFDLRNKLNLELTFWHHYEMENGFDWCLLEVRTESSPDWTTLKRWSRTQKSWVREYFDLSEYSGSKEFQLRFVLQSDNEKNEDGWFIDDILLTGFAGKETVGVHELADIRTLPAAVNETVAKDILHFTAPAGSSIHAVLFDAAGRKVAETHCVAPFEWKLTDNLGRTLAPGVYFVHTYSESGETKTKVVLVK
ncbi:hypothetical protein GX441_03865 [bacterium]|nr:hypothetical protein [bacterium]